MESGIQRVTEKQLVLWCVDLCSLSTVNNQWQISVEILKNHLSKPFQIIS